MRRSALLLLILIVAAGAALRSAAAWHHARVEFDEGRYLDNAVHILRGHGFLTSTVSLFFDDPPRPPRPEDFSSPLYPYLLASLFAVTDVSFTSAKALSVLLSVAAIPLAFLLGRRLFGETAGLIAAAALALQPDQAITGAWAMTESLYMSLLLIALLRAAPLAAPRARPPSWRLALLLGVLAGSLYLIRQNGAAVAAAITALLLAGPLASGETRSRRVLMAAGLTAAALVVSLPWFARNLSAFGSPTYSRMRNVAWAEAGRSLYTPGVPSPSMRRFREEHGDAGLALNILHRSRRVASTLLFAEAGPFRWLSILAFVAPFLPALRAGAAVTLVPALLSAVMFLGVAPWSGALPRYCLPLRPLLYAAGAAGILAGFRAAIGKVRSGAGFRRAAAAVAVLASLAWGAAAAAPTLRSYLAADQAASNAVALDAAGWIAGRTEPDDVIMEGGFLHQYAFLFERGVVWVPYGGMDALLKVADHYRAAYLAVTPDVLRFRPDLSKHWALDGRTIRPLDLPPSLQALYDRKDEGVIIYRIGRGAGGLALE